MRTQKQYIKPRWLRAGRIGPNNRTPKGESVDHKRMIKYFRVLMNAYNNLPKEEAKRIHNAIGVLIQ